MNTSCHTVAGRLPPPHPLLSHPSPPTMSPPGTLSLTNQPTTMLPTTIPPPVATIKLPAMVPALIQQNPTTIQQTRRTTRRQRRSKQRPVLDIGGRRAQQRGYGRAWRIRLQRGYGRARHWVILGRYGLAWRWVLGKTAALVGRVYSNGDAAQGRWVLQQGYAWAPRTIEDMAGRCAAYNGTTGRGGG